ncbi:MAG TPA: NAD-dependent epimerase/dehydratase family protein [Candidatus Binataceae bacterium]|nr:NAD-dependent epimerase/dehydratase family protein [Candidatus Binataceae bacterium]
MAGSGGRRFRWLVTGGAGFLGVHLCRGLVEREQDVVAYDVAEFPREEKVEGIQFVHGDIRDADALKRELSGVDFVVHAAAALALASSNEIDQVNAEGTRIVLAACAQAGVKRVVYIGTTAVYGMPRYHPIFEDAPLNPMGQYGIAKAKAEAYCEAASGIQTVRLRPKSFIGTGRLGIFQILFDWIESGKKIPVLGDGNNRFQLMDVRDLVEAIYLATQFGRDKEVYNIGAGTFGTVNQDLGALLAHARTGSRILHIPSQSTKMLLAILSALHLSPVYRWVYGTADQDSFVSIEKARTDLGWEPRFSNVDALINTYVWYLAEGKEMAKHIGTSHRVAWKQGMLGLAKAVM